MQKKEICAHFQAKYIKLYLVSDTFRFQEQSACKAAPHRPDGEEECDQQDEGSDGKSDLSVESSDEAEEKMPLGAVSGSHQCKKRIFFTHLVYLHQVKSQRDLENG